MFVTPPGAYNPVVTQATISMTICVPGWTGPPVRPPAKYTTGLKREQMAAQHLPGTTRDYEEDHFIPLELGGAPRDPRNLWPEPHEYSKVSDPLENKLHKEVCMGIITLKNAQRAIIRWKRQHG